LPSGEAEMLAEKWEFLPYNSQMPEKEVLTKVFRIDP
jgi:hypothetical protein